MKKVFISHPVSGAVEANLENALRWVRWALDHGEIPFAPYITYLGALDESNDDERLLGMKVGIQILSHCDELWVCGNNITTGMGEEIYRAQTYNIPIYYWDDDEIRDVVLPVGALTPRRRPSRLSPGDSNGKQSTD